MVPPVATAEHEFIESLLCQQRYHNTRLSQVMIKFMHWNSSKPLGMSIGLLVALAITALVPGIAAIVKVERCVLPDHNHDGNNFCGWTKNSPTIVITQPAPLTSND